MQYSKNMKRLLTIVVSLFCLGLSGAFAQAVIKFDKKVHNFGTFKEEAIQKCVFTFTNTGDKPLVIQQAFSSCGCTVPSYPKTPIQPGKTATLTVTYNGKGKFGGHFKKAVTVKTNASNSPVRIYIEGVMEETKK